MARAIVLVLDSFGIGAAADAARFGDVGADTFGHIAAACAEGVCDERGRAGPLHLPTLLSLGLAHAYHGVHQRWPAGMAVPASCQGSYGWAQERSTGKDTPSGHWEMMGVPVLFEWGYFQQRQQSFPAPLLDAIVAQGQLPGFLGNCHASGTEIIQRFGAEHMRSGKPIFYTSADSVFQIAAHETSFGLERLYQLCEQTRALLAPYNIGRVIARPFIGSAEQGFVRTGNRRDYALPPPAATLLDQLCEAGGKVTAIGKIADIFAHRGITTAVKAHGLQGLMDATEQVLLESADDTAAHHLIFTNLVDFDSEFGHRRNICGYADALEAFDQRLAAFLPQLQTHDLLILTADHGNDPSWLGNDHTREYVPVLVYAKAFAPSQLGLRPTFADIGQTLATWFNLSPAASGSSFLSTLLGTAS